MEGSEAAQQKDSVKVAVNIRPLITPELLLGCTDCVTVTPGEPQVQIGPHVFTYDHVFGSTGSPSSLIFEQCVHPLIDSLFRGYNATVLAYGQTGSGKTYTMGTNYTGEANCGGIIPQVMETIFKKADALKDGTEFLIRVSFIEIFKEEVFDLLDASHAALRLDSGSVAKATAPARVPIQIRETGNGGITLAGVTEAEVKTKEEMASFLARGSSSRATGSTNMNSQSSRSHAIFTISMDQKKTSSASDKLSNDDYDILSSKFHLVDLAGSERAKRTGADGLRLKEGIHINRGLLALGNVISALGDEKKRKEGAFVPYRDSKLTRLLQDSLGGNSKTAMIACISPADSNAEETINTLKYANRARNIQNKAVVWSFSLKINRDPVTAEMQKLRSQLEQLQTELLFSRSGSAALEELQLLQQKVSLLELKNSELNHELKERELSYEQLAQSALAAQLEKDQLMLKIESARNGKSWDDIENTDTDQDVEVMKRYILKIQQLESELTRQKFSSTCKNDLHDRFAMDKDLLLDDLGSGCEVGTPDASSAVNFRITPVPAGEADEEKERDHSSMQDKLDKELQELDKRLQQKEVQFPLLNKRAAISKEIAKLKECPQAMSPSARSSRISALENMLSSSSSAMVSMASQLSEAEERERAFNGKGRWNHVRSLPDAKNTMNYLFQLASSSRCQQLDKEVMCKEKEHLICDLKEKVVALNGRIRQLETQVKDLNNQNMLLFTAISEAKNPVGTSRKGTVGSEDGQHYAMRKSIRASHSLHYSKNSFLWSDDMDISDSEKSEGSDADWEASDADYGASDADWECSKKVRRRRQTVSSHLNPNPGSGTTQKSAKSEMASQEKSTSLDLAPQCCSCSKYSSCKTQKCECRASGSHCGGDCGCITSRCSNRVDMKEEKEGGGVVEVSSSDDVDDAKVQEIVKEGVMLLENSMSEKEAQETKSRKPLADIGNGVVKQTGAKPKQRKNWRKSTVQLVPSAPPLPPTAPQNTEPVPRNRDIPLRLPRAMSSPAVDSIPLTDRNAAKPDESMSSNKENVTAVRARSPARPRKNANEKENHLR
uniref:Kinesin motor domain-containing protein n=1 Tax=Oryza glaberrima TaxID=4538 RepID=I1P462_ORYGL